MRWLVILVVMLVSFCMSCFAVESYSSLKQKYDKALEQLEAEHKAKVEALDKAFENALKPLREDAFRDGRAKIYAMADDYLTVCINGVTIVEDYDINTGHKIFNKTIKVAKGDIITVKCSDAGIKKGFCCAIRFTNGYTITSTTMNWKGYKPKSMTKWFDKASIDKIYDTNVIDDPWPSIPQEIEKNELGCKIIWGNMSESTVYLFSVIE